MTEHWQTGGMTRSLPWLVELVPDMFVEISESLAKQKGIKKGDKVRWSPSAAPSRRWPWSPRA